MNELAIKVSYESEKLTVSGRESHEKLGIKAAYKKLLAENIAEEEEEKGA